MKPGQGKERRAKQVGVDTDSAREQSQVLGHLSDEKDRTERHRQREPSTDRTGLS